MPPRTPSTPDSRADDDVADATTDSAVPAEVAAHADASAERPEPTDDAPARLAVVTPDGPPHDAAWFDRLVTDHATAVHRFVVRRAGRSDAEDLTADVLTVAWRRRDDVPDGAELPWLYRTAGFVVANHQRKHRPLPVAEVPDEVSDDDPAVRAIEDETVRRVLAALSPRDRQILLLNAWEGLVGDGLAHVLGVSRGGADAALSRARARLRDAWSALDPD